MVFCIGCAALYTVTATPFYTATAVLLLEPRRPVGSGSSDGALMPSLDVGRPESELQVLRSERLLANVFNSLQWRTIRNSVLRKPRARRSRAPARPNCRGCGPPRRRRQPSCSRGSSRTSPSDLPSGGRTVVRCRGLVHVQRPEPGAARRERGRLGLSPAIHRAAKADAAKNGAEFLQGRVNALASQARSAAAAVTEGTLPDAPTPDADARVIGAALQPLKPSAPAEDPDPRPRRDDRPRRRFLAVALLQAFDRRIRTPQDLVQRAGIPCLAVMPEVLRKTAEGRRETVDLRNVNAPWFLNVKFSTGVRDLRTSIQLALSARGTIPTVSSPWSAAPRAPARP